MNRQEYLFLQAELTTLKKLLNQLPISSVIERMSLEGRKKEVEETIEANPLPPHEPARAKLTFSGKPIVGNYGMFAKFGAEALEAFSDTVTAIGSSQRGPLGARGTLPNREDFGLLITGTALGSFGFELEEVPKDPTFFPSPVEIAIEKAKSLMEATVGSDDDLADAASDTDPRVITSLRSFLKKMADQEAVCAFEFKEKVFRFADVGQVRRSEERLSLENIHEDDDEIPGKFQGVLPKHRTFEFVPDNAEEVLFGKVGTDIVDPGRINHDLEIPVTIKVHKTQVGSGRPRYVLFGYERR